MNLKTSYWLPSLQPRDKLRFRSPNRPQVPACVAYHHGAQASSDIDSKIRSIRPQTCADVRYSPLLWLSTWLSSSQKLAGMDGNRTHPGRLNSAPQTVLKTAEDTSPRSSPTPRTPILAVIATKQGRALRGMPRRYGRPPFTFLETAGAPAPDHPQPGWRELD